MRHGLLQRWAVFFASWLFFVVGSASAGTLFIGSDTEEFGGATSDRLVVATTSGAAFVSQTTISTSYFLNGIGDASGSLYTGTPQQSRIIQIAYDGTQLSTFDPGTGTACCHEDIVVVGNDLYQAHWPGLIHRINFTTGVLEQDYVQSEVVGMAVVGGIIWISKWTDRLVGTWDPVTNLFTSMFSVPTNAGGLAYDPLSNIMWVGREGGMVEPYSLTGTLLGPGFQPFGNIPDTIDGMAFIFEQQTVPEPGTLALLAITLLGLRASRLKLS